MSASEATTTLKSEIGRIVSRLEEARAGGVEWLVSHIGDDGEPVGAKVANSYYRMPWALAVAGRREESAAVLSWAEREALSVEGDLLPGPARVPWTTADASYPLPQLAIAAWHLERYDTAGAIMDTLRAFQHSGTGGAFVERPEPEYRVSRRQDLLCTAQLGMAALTTGRREVADAAYHWVYSLWQAQPELPTRLYVDWNDVGLVTNVPQELAYSLVTDFTKPRQAFFNPGIGAAFLARYYMQTGVEEALQIGRGLLKLSEDGTEAQYDYPDTVQVGKFAWGAAAMLEVEPAERYLRIVLRMGDWYADSQLKDGSWFPSLWRTPEPSDVDALWKTAEHVLHITTMLTALGGYRRRIGASS